MPWMRQKILTNLVEEWAFSDTMYHIETIFIFQTFSFIMINNNFTYKLFSCDKFGFASNISACLSVNITIHICHKLLITLLLESSMSNENSNIQTSWNLCFSALEPEPSSVFRLIPPSMLHQAVQFRNQLIQPVYFKRKILWEGFVFLLIVVTCKHQKYVIQNFYVWVNCVI